jgi:hypothetical protein
MEIFNNTNKTNREAWLAKHLGDLPAGARILDAGAGELRNRNYCGHLDYVSQDFCEYKGVKGGTRTDCKARYGIRHALIW